MAAVTRPPLRRLKLSPRMLARFCRSADFNETLAGVNLPDYVRQQRGKPFTQGAVGAIADAQPDDPRRFSAMLAATREIFMLGQQDGALLQRIPPDGRVLSFAQADLLDVFRLMSLFAQPSYKSLGHGLSLCGLRLLALELTVQGALPLGP